MKVIWIAIALATVAAFAPRAEAKGCREVGNVVGLQRCSDFGIWSRDSDTPRLWFDLGYTHHAYNSQPYTLGTTALSATDTNQLATTSGAATMRILGGVGRFFYVGGDLQPGWINKVPTTPGPVPNKNGYFSTHAIMGAHASLFRFAVAGELAAGFRAELFSDCDAQSSCSVWQTRRELEARVRTDTFIVPWLSIGVMFGQSLIDADEHSLMFDFGVHVRVMDGMW